MREQLVYKRVDGHELALHLHRPEGDGPRPGVVFFFGGGWARGTPEQFFLHCQQLAARGMVAISAEYRVRERHGVEPFACLEDAKSAMRFVRAKHQTLGIDPTRLAAGGGSAGGQLAAATTLVPGFDAADEDPGSPCHADALLLFNPVLDNNPEDGFGAKRLGQRWREFSPAHHVRPGLPPTVIHVGDRDPGLPVAVLTRFQHAMTEAGNRCDLHIYGGQPHGFFNHREPATPYFAYTSAITEAFLASLGWLGISAGVVS